MELISKELAAMNTPQIIESLAIYKRIKLVYSGKTIGCLVDSEEIKGKEFDCEMSMTEFMRGSKVNLLSKFGDNGLIKVVDQVKGNHFYFEK